MAGRAFITGIQGFTGQYLAKELFLAGYRVFGFTQSEGAIIDNVEKIYSGDLNDFSNLSRIIKEVQPDIVANLAGISFVAHGDSGEIYRANLLGVRNLLEVLNYEAKCLRAVLLVSSAQVYGNASGVIDETTPFAPANDYAISKLAMEYLAKVYADRLPITIVRPFNYIGIGQSGSFLLPKIIAHINDQMPVIELGNLDVARDFSDVRNVVHYYRLLLENPAARGEIYNVCSGVAYKLEEVISLLESLSGHHLEVRVNPAFMRENEVKKMVGGRTKLEMAVGKVPEIKFVDTLKWMLEATA